MSFSGSDNEAAGDGGGFEPGTRDSEADVDNEDYSFFNLPRTASEADITAAYKRLTKVYHPDKHVDEDRKKRAEMMFNKLKKAYEGERTRIANYIPKDFDRIPVLSPQRSEEASHLRLSGKERPRGRGLGTHPKDKDSRRDPRRI